MSSGDVLLQIHHLLSQQNLVQTKHRLERETGVFFDREYIADLIRQGKFKKATKYLEGFIVLPSTIEAPREGDQNQDKDLQSQQLSLKIFHDLHLQRYLEAIFDRERYEAFQILQSDMSYMLRQSNFEHYSQLVDLLSSDRIPENVIKHFVSSRDPIRWKENAENYFIPHIFSLFDKHPQLRKVEILPANHLAKNSNHSTLQPSAQLNSHEQKKTPIITTTNDLEEESPFSKFRGVKREYYSKKTDVMDLSKSPDHPTHSTISKRIEQNYSNQSIQQDFQRLAYTLENGVAKMAISHSGTTMAMLDSRGKIFLYNVNLKEFYKSEPTHSGFNRHNILPMGSEMIAHSISFSPNEQWLCSSSGGSGSLYNAKQRENRKPISNFNNISFITFDSSDVPQPGNIIFGLQDGSIEILDTKGNTTFRMSEHKARLLCVAKRNLVLASICADGLLKVAQIDMSGSGQYYPTFQEELHNWHRDQAAYACTNLEFGDIDSRLHLLVSYSEAILLFDVFKNAIVSKILPPDRTTFTKATFSINRKCIHCTTSNNEFMIFATEKINELALVAHFPLVCSRNSPTDLICHPVFSQHVFIGNSVGNIILLTLNLPNTLTN